jgi:glucan biosynthesis protein
MVFDVDIRGRSPIDLRAFLRAGARTLSETWIYQLYPQS